MRNLPKCVRIGLFDYTIETLSKIDGDVLSRYGDTNHDLKRLRVCEGYSDVQRALTLLHEILHAVWNEAGLENDDKEGRIVRAIALGLMQVFRDNSEVNTVFLQTLDEGASTR
jgi:hypothetical protein